MCVQVRALRWHRSILAVCAITPRFMLLFPRVCGLSISFIGSSDVTGVADRIGVDQANQEYLVIMTGIARLRRSSSFSWNNSPRQATPPNRRKMHKICSSMGPSEL
ncbi:hypothetical protein BDR04DRAFT_263631 [Suillus decipiens]|nr:hypothetical protein BDR04DRAFT_263631 [Suillus decipiens]